MWVFLQYLLGFRKLGYEVHYVDSLPGESCVDNRGRSCNARDSWNVEYLAAAMATYGLQSNWTLLVDGSSDCFGISRLEMLRRVREAECVINIMGYVQDDEVRAAARRLVFLDIDPGFGQMWRALELADIFAGHDQFLTVGLNVGDEHSLVPTCGLKWIPTPPPVALDYWPTAAPRADLPFTSVCTWRGIFSPVEYQGRTFGLRVHEFRKFMELPSATGGQFQLALDIDARDSRDLLALSSNGWQLVEPADVVQTPEQYQSYIERSGAEFGVAKQMYVATRGGWVSDRTVCYLASGKPVLVQDTGIRDKLPTGEGLLVFSTMEEAIDGIERIRRDYVRHARAARRVAEECFDSDKVLRRLLEAVAA